MRSTLTATVATLAGTLFITFGLPILVFMGLIILSSTGAGGMGPTSQHLAQILVAAAGEDEQVHPIRSGIREQPGERMRGLERWDDPFELGKQLESGDRLAVLHRHVARPALVRASKAFAPSP